jgi:hypothetical protein
MLLKRWDIAWIILKKVQTPLIGFTGDTLYSEGVIKMRVEFGQSPNLTSTMV